MMHAHVKIIPKGTMRIRLAQPILDEILNIFLVMALYHIFTPSWDNFRCIRTNIGKAALGRRARISLATYYNVPLKVHKIEFLYS